MNSQELGLSELREGAANNSLRSILSTLTLLMFHLYITVILGKNNMLPGCCNFTSKFKDHTLLFGNKPFLLGFVMVRISFSLSLCPPS